MAVQENRTKLLDALRADMPPLFRWNFNMVYDFDLRQGCGRVGCAIGLAFAIGLFPDTDTVKPAWDLWSDSMAELLGLPRNVAEETFAPETDDCGVAKLYRVLYQDVTPQMVADQLEIAFKKYPV